ncbi:ArsR family transcriptional regulator [Rubrobacter tropicus]|uniref:ArsR family transcriptional regulator n=1 Tax=Rubrobacter tropicus TaxID=2653851 RepID=A0A6G8QB59_9ACTN|nr:arylsulfotransferase family protein [Rubrobacter tropicus]QIN83720.1 ArsR family transcriptional regulator [Rubrobacter tropicus]
MGERSTRRQFLGTAAAGLACIAFAGVAGCQLTGGPQATASSVPRPGGAWTFRSRPDLHPPAVEVLKSGRGISPGYIFLAPKKDPDEEGPGQDGPMILDNEGHPVWFRPAPPGKPDVMNFRAQTYKGRPVLTWWGGVHGGFGDGEYVIFDDSYREVKRFKAGNGYPGDHHEFLITTRDTALITIYAETPYDLSPYGGPKDGLVMDGVAQEIDIETGEVLFEWHSLEHVDVGESFYEPINDPTNRFDYFHINSIDVDRDENWLISARRTSTVYKIDRKSGEVIWRLGGEKSDFEMGEGTEFVYQHDARRQPDGTITLFDNYGPKDEGDLSRGMVLELDEEAMKATLVREYPGGGDHIADTQGNMQTLPDGNVFVGWGSEPYLSEFDGEGDLIFNARFEPWGESYRAFRLPWSGRPDDAPSVAVEAGREGEVMLYASWNGATEMTSWRVFAGPSPDELEVLDTVPRHGFETVIRTRTAEAYVGVQAEDGSGRGIGSPVAVGVDRRRAGNS